MAFATPFISVIVPSYNRERHLTQCVSSVLNQTYRNFEVIVIDDGSTDQTGELVARLMAADPRVRYLPKRNGGVSSARNVGIQAAKGNFIALLDSDDAWHSWKLEVQMAALQALPQVGMIWTEMSAISEQGALLHDRYLHKMYGSYQKLTGPLFQNQINIQIPRSAGLDKDRVDVQHGEIYPQMMRGNLVHTSTVLLRKERALETGLFDERYRRAGEDFGFHLRTCRLGPVAMIDEASTLYRIGAEDQLTHRRFQVSLAEAFLQTIQEEAVAVGADMPLTRRELNAILSEAHSWLGTELAATNSKSAASRQLLTALYCNPQNPEAWHQLVRLITPHRLRQLIKKVWLKQPLPQAPAAS